ncbi:Na/Pi cotransporter family protein [Martelella sp. HB161492]|uniref:Na/Pi cotransporter family protein n=1 Tax=Martelella sp. HB161492 TaxID=2720726 RepID=UPI00159022CE|nr:Na/Pi cotransporter family protein [Martelella sp. HB161492]
MGSLLVVLQIAGSVALLLFGLGLVRDGVTTAFGVRLKTALGLGTKTGSRAFVSGLVATLGLQSSTATALLTSSFVERELIKGRMAQIVLLGANVGTALTALVISTGVAALSPALLLAGYILGRREGALRSGIARALIGVGLMLVAITLLEAATVPLRDAPAMASFLSMLDQARPVALIAAALIAAACSSSLAAVLLVLSLGLPGGLCVVMVLGANIGGAIPPVIATLGGKPSARRLTTGNLVIRIAGSALAMPFANLIASGLGELPLTLTGLAVEVHLVFNLMLAVLVWPVAGRLSDGLEHVLPDADRQTPLAAKWLNEAALDMPALALAGASRQALAIGDDIERMLEQTRLAFRKNDLLQLSDVSLLEQRVDLCQQQVKTYLSRLGREASEEERRRSITILDYVINLEHIGDIIERGLVVQVRKKVGLGLHFSDEGYRELDAMFLLTFEVLRMAQTVFMTRDRDLAKRLMELKIEVRKHERQSAQRHLIRLREGKPESRETSSVHLDILRDLKRMNAHFVSVAHPILDEEGLLVESRLRER